MQTPSRLLKVHCYWQTTLSNARQRLVAPILSCIKKMGFIYSLFAYQWQMKVQNTKCVTQCQNENEGYLQQQSTVTVSALVCVRAWSQNKLVRPLPVVVSGGIRMAVVVQCNWDPLLMDPPGYNLLSNLALLVVGYKAIVQNAKFLEIWFFIEFVWWNSISSPPRSCIFFLHNADKCFQEGDELLFWGYFCKRK